MLGGWALHSHRANRKRFEDLTSSLGDLRVEGSICRPPGLAFWKVRHPLPESSSSRGKKQAVTGSAQTKDCRGAHTHLTWGLISGRS